MRAPCRGKLGAMKTFCSGSSLVEAMVALAVFAVGSAGAGAWVAMSVAVDAKASRMMAVVASAADLRERLRANVAGVAAGDYQVAYPGAGVAADAQAPYAGSEAASGRRAPATPDRSLPPRPVGCAAGCDAAALAADDLRRFNERALAAAGPTLRYALRCHGDTRCVLHVTWRGDERYAVSFVP